MHAIAYARPRYHRLRTAAAATSATPTVITATGLTAIVAPFRYSIRVDDILLPRQRRHPSLSFMPADGAEAR